MSRNLNDDFDEDDAGLPGGGSLDLEQGAGGVGTGAYDGGGMEFDDDPYGEHPEGNGALELDLPHGSATALRSGGAAPPLAETRPVSPPPPGGASSGPAGPAPAARTSGAPPAAPTSGAHPAAPASGRPTAASIIAKYPAAPKPWQAPKYAVQVLLRQFELRSQLESLRRRRSPDVPLYESALRAYDAKTFRLGMAINCALFATATFIVFLPVILRFMRAD